MKGLISPQGFGEGGDTQGQVSACIVVLLMKQRCSFVLRLWDKTLLYSQKLVLLNDSGINVNYWVGVSLQGSVI